MTRNAFIEVHSIDYVPHAERHGKVRDLWPVWFSGDANLATVAVGVIGIGLGGTMFWTAMAVLGGCALFIGWGAACVLLATFIMSKRDV